MYNIYPQVKFQQRNDGYFTKPKEFNAYFETQPLFFDELKTSINFKISTLESANLIFQNNDVLNDQAYELLVFDDVIEIHANSESGYYYGFKTLKQLLELDTIECGYISDKPDLKIRGFMHDISRNKVPKVETVKYIIDIMSDLKMNHLELYVEGFSFEYVSFSKYLEDNCYITQKEYKELEHYAKLHFIDLVPNQNGFGHMQEWLAKDEFSHLAEAPDGIDLWGTHRPPSTLNANDPGSLELIKQMYDDMLSISSSNYFHMNFDEPFELGKDRTKEDCLTRGEGNVYMDYALKAIDVIKKYNKTPLIWGDVLLRHDDVLSRIPKDVIFVDWGYEGDYPFDQNLLKLKNAKIKFMAAPGTTSWCSLLTRTYDYLENISSAIWHTYELGGEGVILADWGDVGHLQHLSSSFAPLVYMGLLSYRVHHGVFKDLKPYLNKYIFKDSLGLAADIFMDAGTYYKYEPHYTGNGTVTFYTMVWALNSFKEKEPIEYFRSHMKYNLLNFEQYKLLIEFFNQKQKEINICSIDSIFKKELCNSIDILKLLASINVGYNETIDLNFRIKCFKEVIENIEEIKKDLKDIWLYRNKYSRLDKSLEELNKVKQFAIMSIDYYQGGK